jgi:hypothetical protein
MVGRLFIISAVVLCGSCKTSGTSGAPPEASGAPASKTADDASRQPADAAASAAAARAWQLESSPIEPRCGDQAIPLPPVVAPAEPPVEKKLAARDAVASCHDQPSAAATCSCLAGSIATWRHDQLSPRGECEAAITELDANAALVRIHSVPADASLRAAGTATFFVAKRGPSWSAIAAIAVAADADQVAHPGDKETSAIEHTAVRSIDGGTLYWIEARHESQDRSLGGTLQVYGSTEGTICRIGATDVACFEPLVLGAWSYREPCKVQTLGVFRATVTPTAATVRLEHGQQYEAIVGTYHL